MNGFIVNVTINTTTRVEVEVEAVTRIVNERMIVVNVVVKTVYLKME